MAKNVKPHIFYNSALCLAWGGTGGVGKIPTLYSPFPSFYKNTCMHVERNNQSQI